MGALREHWPEYLIEAALIGAFMICAGVIGTLFGAGPDTLRRALPGPLARRAVMGAATGLTAVALIYSPWGQRSGGHLNPAMTLTFYRLGKVAGWDALFYVLAQLAGAVTGLLLVKLWFGAAFSGPPVSGIVTMPGMRGALVAFVAELGISCLLMAAVLTVSNSRRAHLTGLCAGLLVALFITFESPLSGTSMNPARSFAAALHAGAWQGLWVYVAAPPLGMLLAAAAYVAARGRAAVRCAKLHHGTRQRCIFRCGYATASEPHGADPT
jgi:aquaporin Z